jgi:hypothetical protein
MRKTCQIDYALSKIRKTRQIYAFRQVVQFSDLTKHYASLFSFGFILHILYTFLCFLHLFQPFLPF